MIRIRSKLQREDMLLQLFVNIRAQTRCGAEANNGDITFEVGGGALYAMIEVTAYAYRDGKSFVRINSVTNAKGSRNLMTLR